MKRYCKAVSIFSVIALVLTELVGIILFAQGIPREISSLKEPIPDEGLGRLEYYISRPLGKAFIVVLIVAIVILIVEAAVIIRQCVKAVKDDSFEGFMTFSLVGLGEVVINFVLFWFFPDAIIGIPDERVLKETDRWLLVYFFLVVFLILSLIVANKGKRNESVERLVTGILSALVIICGLLTMMCFVLGKYWGAAICLATCIFSIVVLAVKATKE